MKRIGMILALLTLLFSVAQHAAAQPQLTLGSATAEQGLTDSLTLSLVNGAVPYAGVNAKIILPDDVIVTGVSEGALLSGGSFTIEYAEFNDGGNRGVTVIAYSGTDVFNADNGIILTLDVRVAWDATPGAYSASFAATNTNPLINSRYAISNEDGTASIAPSVLSGSFTISAMTDTDGDLMADSWEQEIVDAYTGDGIDDISQVLATADFDGGGTSNLVEFRDGTDPINPLDDPYAANIPTVSEWGMIIFTLLLLTAGMVVIRRRQVQ